MIAQFRIVTNGEDFRIECRDEGSFAWRWLEAESPTYYKCTEIVQFGSYKAALRWLRKQYGEQAPVAERPWRPV